MIGQTLGLLDDEAFGPNSYNPCMYVHNNPINDTDPSGLIACSPVEWAGCVATCQAQAAARGRVYDRVTGCDSQLVGIKVIGGQCYLDWKVTCECKDKPKNNCTPKQQMMLQAAVNAACKGAGAGMACDPNSGMSAQDALANATKFLNCAAARDVINQICFNGGDAGHQQAAGDARRAALKCTQLAAAGGGNLG